MSTSTEITRIQTARNTIRDKLIDLGLALSADTLDKLATAIAGIVNNGAVSAEVKEGDSYTIPAGYHNGSGTVLGVAGGGNYVLQAKEITPTKSQQSVTPDAGKYGLSSVTVKPIPDAYQNVSGVTATAADVLVNKIIVDATGKTIAGTLPENGTVTATLDATTGKQSYTIPKGNHSGSGKVSIVLEEKTATPKTTAQTMTPTAGKVISKFTVEAIPAKFGDAANATAEAGDILAGETAISLDANGNAVEVEGTMPDQGTVTATIDGLTVTSYTIPAGKHSGSGTVSLTDDIEKALAAI